MADLVLGGLPRFFKAFWALKKAVATVQQNKEECRGILRCVATDTGLLSLLKQSMDTTMPQAIARTLDDLSESIEKALKLVADCQQRSAFRQLWGAGDMAKSLRRVQKDIDSKLDRVNFSVTMLKPQISVYVTNTIHYVGAHPPLPLPQVAGEVNLYDSILSAIEMRPGVNSNTTMVATGNVVPYASSSGVAEFNWSERESTLRLSLKKHISKGSHAFVLKQEIVIRVAMPCDGWRSKARALVAALGGVDSVDIKGECRDKVVVVGQGLDAVKLVSGLRKKIGCADLLHVGSVGPSSSNGEPLARQRFSDPSSGTSFDSEEEEDEESPRPSSSKVTGKQSL